MGRSTTEREDETGLTPSGMEPTSDTVAATPAEANETVPEPEPEPEPADEERATGGLGTLSGARSRAERRPVSIDGWD